jgi:hypothetical protein
VAAGIQEVDETRLSLASLLYNSAPSIQRDTDATQAAASTLDRNLQWSASDFD